MEGKIHPIGKVAVDVVGAQDVQVDVVYNTSTEQFEALVGEQIVMADSLGMLRRLIADTVTGARLEAPFVSPSGRRGVMRGFHAANHDVLVTWEDGAKDRLNSYIKIGVNVPDEDVAELAALTAERNRLEDEVKAVEAKRKAVFAPYEITVKDAMEAALGEDLFDRRRGLAVAS